MPVAGSLLTTLFFLHFNFLLYLDGAPKQPTSLAMTFQWHTLIVKDLKYALLEIYPISTLLLGFLIQRAHLEVAEDTCLVILS